MRSTWNHFVRNQEEFLFGVETMVRGYHVYNNIWSDIMDKEFDRWSKKLNTTYVATAVVKGYTIVDHIIEHYVTWKIWNPPQNDNLWWTGLDGKNTSVIARGKERNQVYDEWKNAAVVLIHKKGYFKLCNNWRGISLLDAVGKILVRIKNDYSPLQRRYSWNHNVAFVEVVDV